jgi:hypothetical protein
MLLHSLPVKQPLAIVLYERLMPGSQLVNRLQDISYRVLTLTNPAGLAATAEAEKPLLVFADLEFTNPEVIAAIAGLRRNPGTSHIPLIAFANEPGTELTTSVGNAGATLVVSDTAVLTHLPQLLEKALRVE